MKLERFKKGDFVYYMKKDFGTIPCQIVKVNKKTLILEDGFDTYKNISPSNVTHQSERPSFINR